MKPLPTLLVALACALSTLPVSADEVTTTDGRVVVGKVSRKSDRIEIETRTGVVTIAAGEVDSIRTEKELREELRELAEGQSGSAFAELELARTALGYGLERELWQHLDSCMAALDEKPSRAIERRLDELLATLEPEILGPDYADKNTRVRVRSMLRRVRDSAPRSHNRAVMLLLADEPEARKELQDRVRRELLPEQRLCAIEALRRASPEDQGFIQARAILDKDRDVRLAVVRSLRGYQDTGPLVTLFSRGLLHDSPAIRIRSAEALGELGDGSAIPVLETMLPLAGVPRAAALGQFSVRAHMKSITSQSYIRDFDVEIAQAAAVANPVIGTVDRGVVLDVNVPAVTSMKVPIEKAYRAAIRKLRQ